MSEKSHPVRGAWIEIRNEVQRMATEEASHPVRGAWIEIKRKSRLHQ